MADDAEDPNQDGGAASAGEGNKCLSLWVGLWVSWTVLAVGGLVVLVCRRSIHVPKEVRVLAGAGLVVAFVGFIGGVAWYGEPASERPGRRSIARRG
ncbi:hypothetical protein ZWY2020_026397 [Hordeum vulgare]|nr:hypothetical protein ZWY2020_026397 [Hordeum vulgare]